MRKSLALAGIATTSVLLLAGISTSAFAASAMSEAFVANVRPNVDYLDLSSRAALDQSSSPAIRSFAYSEAKEQTITGNSLVAWTQTNTARGEAVALGSPVTGPLAPVTDLAVLPLNVATGVTTGVTTGVGDVLTGRSVAVDAPLVVTPAPQPPVGSQLLPSEQDDLARLKTMNSHDFNVLYKSTQLDALRQLATLYRDYERDGDDPALRAIAARELPRVTRRIAELRRL